MEEIKKNTTATIEPKVIEELGKNAAVAYDASAEIDITKHKIYDESARPKKLVKKDGQSRYIDPARLPMALQDIIVTRRVAFMNLGKVKLFAEPSDKQEERAFSLLQRLRDNNKVAFKESEICDILNRELQCAKLWYSTEATDASHWGGFSGVKKDFKMQVLSPSRGDTLLPVFDNTGNLIYFGRQYKRSKSIDEILAQPEGEKEVECFDIYSSTQLAKFERADSDWSPVEVIPLPYGKIPVIYYSRQRPIWANVQPLIERLETVLSNFADTNDYHASPTLVFKNVKNATAQEKGENGKAVLLDGDSADVKYVTWDHSVQAVELEIDTLVNAIYSLTQTPNISFEEMKSLGDLSGVAFDRVFIDAHLASRREIEGGYGELIQRGINLEMALLATMDTTLRGAFSTLSVTFEAPHFKLDDLDADVSLAIKAKDAGLISRATAIGMSGLVTNVEDEEKRIDGENLALEKTEQNGKE